MSAFVQGIAPTLIILRMLLQRQEMESNVAASEFEFEAPVDGTVSFAENPTHSGASKPRGVGGSQTGSKFTEEKSIAEVASV